jgi:hypothetical protein
VITISPEDQRQTHAGIGPSISIPCRSATDSTSSMSMLRSVAVAATAREKPSMTGPGAYHECHGIHVGLISDGVRSASGQRNYVT